ncbi:proteinase B [Mucor velutinosus]|uniref:Proteinase B n=1 Tax=Mucor velutinosus TaxID=708070 RepID=A0AAN7I4C9_9FUNG|nr:proteinase B [Mucor velutinosus]
MFTDIPKNLLIKVMDYSDSMTDLVQYCLVCKLWSVIAKPLLDSRRSTKLPDIPGTLVTKIINCSDSVANLAQFRLVCKSWNVIAEPLMFSRRIKISSSYAALAFYGHLYRRPNYGKLINHLHFEEDFLPVAIQHELLRLAFTPSMERITGEIDDDDFYLLMSSIADKARDKFDKLKAIPHPSCYSVVYNCALLNFKSTLEEITFSLRDENGEDYSSTWDLSRFESFVNLTKFELEADLEAVFDLEDALAGCSRLKELTVKVYFNDRLHVKSEVEAWAPINVKIVNTVKKLVITRECRSDLLEYLLFKYPNTDTIDIDVEKPLILSSNNLHRTLNIIKAIRSHKVKFAVKSNDLIESLRFLIADGIQFRMKEDEENENFCIEISNLL